MKKILAATLAVTALTACNSGSTSSGDADAPRVLVLYYSQGGATKNVATELQKQLGADIEEITVEVPYDGTYGETIDRCKQEMENNEVPALNPIKADLSKYDVIFLGYPIWFGTYARPIAGLVKTQAFQGKKVVPFCTFGSGGLQASINDLKAALPQAEVAEVGYGVRTIRVNDAPEEINRFLIENGYKAGEVEPLPAYGEQHPVDTTEVNIFNQACGDYKFPLGTPVSAAKRTTATSTDYLYEVDSTTPDGKDVKAQIYVTVPKADDAKPVFTQVVR